MAWRLSLQKRRKMGWVLCGLVAWSMQLAAQLRCRLRGGHTPAAGRSIAITVNDGMMPPGVDPSGP
jgi:hypothetical protein